MAEIVTRSMGVGRGGPIERPDMPEPPRSEGVSITFHVSAEVAYMMNEELQRRNGLNPRAPAWTLASMMEALIRERFPQTKK